MGKKLTIYLIDGNEFGPRTIEIGNWSGKAIYSPSPTIHKVVQRDELEKPGVYFFKSIPDNDVFSEKIYIGEAEKISDRLRQHLRDEDKEFTEFIAFVSKDEMLTKSHIKFLESKLITLAKEAKTAEIENSITPTLPTLPEADISDMKYFLEQMKLILPLMGFGCLVPIVVKKALEEEFQKNESIPEDRNFTLKSKDFDAKMYESERGYIVVAGSQCNKQLSNSISESWIKLRQKLLDSDALIEKDDYLEFTEDTVFNSVSAASSVILGSQSSGPRQWINQDGRTFKEVQLTVFANGE